MSIKKSTSTQLTLEEKYSLYESAVQNAEFEIDFFIEKYEEFFGKSPRIFREDFCGTGKIACEWVKRHPKNEAYGIDLDSEPIEYGKKHHYSQLNPAQKKRMQYKKMNVLDAYKHPADIVAALNFSYFIFKKRSELLNYFKSVRKSLSTQGIFYLDIFGGTECFQRLVDRVEHDKFNYFWDCDEFNAITHECLYKIHFQMKGQKKKLKDVFVYDWRMWSLPEIQDILEEAGFSQVHIFWEGDDDEGGGDGHFEISRTADNCESWVSYIAALP